MELNVLILTSRYEPFAVRPKPGESGVETALADKYDEQADALQKPRDYMASDLKSREEKRAKERAEYIEKQLYESRHFITDEIKDQAVERFGRDFDIAFPPTAG